MKNQLGYKLMLAFKGLSVPKRMRQWISNRPVGGFTIFRPLNVKNLAQVRALTSELQARAARAGQSPLIIAADQEGGQLNALGEETTLFPGNMALGAAGDKHLAYEVGRAQGRELAALGINVNYAPNCDLNTNPANPACGIRSFGDEPTLAAEMAAALVSGLQAEGVAATIKHFPGKGDAQVDSHYEMPLIDHDRARLEEIELRPFRAAIDAGAKLVMSGHFAIPALTGTTDLPATLSRAVMRDFVRQELGFEGIVITDALDMGAITQGAGQLIDVIAAMRAEVDLMLLTADSKVQERLYAGLQLAYSRGLLDAAHLEPSLRRIMALKRWVASHPQPDLEVVGCAAHQSLAQTVAERSMTLVRNEAGLLPLRLYSSARIAVIMPQPKDLTPADTSSYIKPTLAAAVRDHHPTVDEFITGHPPSDEEITALRGKIQEYDLILIGTLSASMDSQQARLVQTLLPFDIPTVTVALRTPYDLTVYPEAQTHVCTYSILPSSMKALAAALWGKIEFKGQLPVKLRSKNNKV
ncbi:MAG: glycoside hydrolase family 3 N-terminal domain-containing protein [Ardenticatenaceae bacterium]|nr:glycoside hydrolase family 3 N-terminal domain-containing protein [Ardenticatenaceae bacterium]